MRKIIRILPLIVASLTLAAGKTKRPKPSPSYEIPADSNEALAKAEDAFKNGDFVFSREICNNLETKASGFDQTQLSRLYTLRVRLEFAGRNPDAARAILTKILAINPKFELDPLSDPPDAIAMLRELKGSQASPNSPNNGAQTTGPSAAASANDAIDSSSLIRKRAGFWGALLPFGIGHFETGDYYGGATFLTTDALSFYVSPFFRGKESWSPDVTSDLQGSKFPNRASEILFAGSWGYEILDVMPSLLARDNFRANWTRYWLSFFPLGVGQMKNGHTNKALVLGAAEAGLITYALVGKNPEQRKTASQILVGTMLYGAFDGWLHHKWLAEDKSVFERTGWQILPTLSLLENKVAVPSVIIEKKL